MNILISGASGFLGNALKAHWQKKHHIFCLTRDKRAIDNQHLYWQPAQQLLALPSQINVDVVINLNGENIAAKRWGKARKQTLINSRLQATNTLIQAINQFAHKPKLVINASAIGFYGNSHETPVDETSPTGHNFSAQLCQQWEQAAEQFKVDRLVKIRTGIVLNKVDGALAKMLPAFRFGLGGKLGSGEQYMSWISLTDYCRAIDFIIEQQAISGAVNLTAPNPVTNAEFSQTLAKHLHRPCFANMPSFMVKLLFGAMGQELLLEGSQVIPEKLLAHQFQFAHTNLTDALVAEC